VTDCQHDYIYCSPLFDVQSLDESLSHRRSPAHRLRDTLDDPETALVKARDKVRLSRWIGTLPHALKVVAQAVMTGETQASLARRLGLTEAAISKRMKRLALFGRTDLADLRASPLLH